MKTANLISASLLAAALAFAPVFATAGQSDARQDVDQAGQNTKNAAKDTGHAVKKGTKKAYHATKHGTQKAYDATKHGTKKAARKTKGTYDGAKDGAENTH